MRKLITVWIVAVALMSSPLALWAGDSEQPAPGQVPPDALGSGPDGDPITVSGYRGKVVIVTFWASWCGPCRRELPVLDKVQKIVGREHLEVIAINMKEPRREYLDVIRSNKGLDLTYVHDAKGVVSDRYGVKVLPNMFIIDREGKVAHVHRGYSPEMLDGFVKEMLSLLPPEALSKPTSG